MSGRAYGLVWLASLSIALFIGTFLVILGSPGNFSSSLKSWAFGETPNHRSVIIGSSLSGAAFPPFFGDKLASLGSGIRKYAPVITGDEVVTQLHNALDATPDFIIIEVRPFTKPRSDDWLRTRLNSVSRAARIGLKSLLNQDPRLDWMTVESSWLHGDFSELVSKANHPPQKYLDDISLDRLRDAVSRAELIGTQIILTAFPRARTVVDQGDERTYFEIRARVEGIANNLLLPLFAPSIGWPDSLFSDPAHLNERGRERYLSELKAWWKSR